MGSVDAVEVEAAEMTERYTEKDFQMIEEADEILAKFEKLKGAEGAPLFDATSAQVEAAEYEPAGVNNTCHA